MTKARLSSFQSWSSSLLTVLGFALMLTTFTEKDIAINYRWGEQAFFNADAALEYGKNVVAAHMLNNGDFASLLPPARNDVTVPSSSAPWGDARPVDPAACADPAAPGCRDYQYYVDRCQPDGTGPCVRIYVGRVLTRPDGTLAQYDFRQAGASVSGDLDGDGSADLEGSITIWARRPVVGDRDYGAPTPLDQKQSVTYPRASRLCDPDGRRDRAWGDGRRCGAAGIATAVGDDRPTADGRPGR